MLTILVIVAAGAAWWLRPVWLANKDQPAVATKAATAPTEVVNPDAITLTDQQMQQLKIGVVEKRSFTIEKRAIGQIALNEDRTTPVFSPYNGRVVRLLARPGDEVKAGTPLFEIDAPDLVQAESDLVAAVGAAARAKNQLDLVRRTASRQEDLYKARAIAQKDVDQAQADLRSADSDFRSAQGALAGVRDRVRIFGKSAQDIARIEQDRRIDAVVQVLSPIAGTVTSRKVGPGQYVKPDNSEPLFVVADLSTMWLLANVPEADIAMVKPGQSTVVRVMAYPNEKFKAQITYVADSVNPQTRRIGVRSEIANPDRRLKPDMFASFRITTSEEVLSPGVSSTSIIREGERLTLWVGVGKQRFTEREVKIGQETGSYTEITEGLQPGETVVLEGGLFLNNEKKTGGK